MEHASKMILVPNDAYTSLLTQKQQQDMRPTTTQMSRLDEQMDSILKDPSLPTDVKFLRYQDTLRRYQNLQDEQRKPLEVSIKQPDTEQEMKQRLPEHILTSLAKPYRSAGRLMADHINMHPEIQWDDANQLVVKTRSL